MSSVQFNTRIINNKKNNESNFRLVDSTRRYTIWDIVLSLLILGTMAASVAAIVKSENRSFSNVQQTERFGRNVTMQDGLTVQGNLSGNVNVIGQLNNNNATVESLSVSQSIQGGNSASVTFPNVTTDIFNISNNVSVEQGFQGQSAEFNPGILSMTNTEANFLGVLDTLQLNDLQIPVSSLSATSNNPFTTMWFTLVQPLAGGIINGQEAYAYKGTAAGQVITQNNASNLIYPPLLQGPPILTGFKGAETLITVPDIADTKNTINPLTVSNGLWLIWGQIRYDSTVSPGVESSIVLDLRVGDSATGQSAAGYTTQSFAFNTTNNVLSTKVGLFDARSAPSLLECAWQMAANGGDPSVDLVNVNQFILYGVRKA